MSNTIQNKIFPGKILIVDDKFDDVKELMLKLLNDNIPVQYWDSQSELKYTLTNVRILILDLKLTEDQGEKYSDNYFVPAAQVLKEIQGPYVLIILSGDYDEGDIHRLKDAYKDRYDDPLIIFEDEIGINKDIEPNELYNKIRTKFEKIMFLISSVNFKSNIKIQHLLVYILIHFVNPNIGREYYHSIILT